MNNSSLISIYKQVKSFQTQFENNKSWITPLPVNSYHTLIDELSKENEEDFNRFKVPSEACRLINGSTNVYDRLVVLTQVGRVVAHLEALLNIPDSANQPTGSPVTIINTNTIAVNIEQSLQQLIQGMSGEEKQTLEELDKELDKPQQDKGKLKEILMKLLNISFELFIKILPEVLKRYQQ